MEGVVESTSYVELESRCCCLWPPRYQRLCLVSQSPSSVTGIVVPWPPDSMALSLFESSLYACVRATAAMQLSFPLAGPRLVVAVWHRCLLPSGGRGVSSSILAAFHSGTLCRCAKYSFSVFFLLPHYRLLLCGGIHVSSLPWRSAAPLFALLSSIFSRGWLCFVADSLVDIPESFHPWPTWRLPLKRVLCAIPLSTAQLSGETAT